MRYSKFDLQQYEGRVYESSRYGKYTILRIASNFATIKFMETGTIDTVDIKRILHDSLYDPYKKTLYGVACRGRYHNNPLHSEKRVDVWRKMIQRCYDPNCPSYKEYGAIGVRVCERWLCYEYYLEDLPFVKGFDNYINNYGSETYHLDKDLLQQNIPKSQRIYSKDTCCFITTRENTQLMSKDNKDGCSSKYYGVYKTKSGTYQSTIMVNNKKYFLGTFLNELDAAYAYNQEALKHPETIHNLNKMPKHYIPNDSRPKYFSKYCGVEKSYKVGYEYKASATVQGVHSVIGYYNDEIEAAYAYNQYIIANQHDKRHRRINKLRAINVIAAKVVNKDNYK